MTSILSKTLAEALRADAQERFVTRLFGLPVVETEDVPPTTIVTVGPPPFPPEDPEALRRRIVTIINVGTKDEAP